MPKGSTPDQALQNFLQDLCDALSLEMATSIDYRALYSKYRAECEKENNKLTHQHAAPIETSGDSHRV